MLGEPHLEENLLGNFDAIHPVVTEDVVLLMLLRKTISQGYSKQESLLKYEEIPLGEK